MAKILVLLSFLLVSGCLAWREQPQQNECQLRRLHALKPDNRIESEAGSIETWNPNNKQFQCVRVALSRCTLNRNALRRPFYTNAPQEIYIQQGSGLFGLILPGCPQNFEEPQRQGQRPEDRHQKVHHFRKGDLIAVPTGVAFWMYNPHDTPVIAVSLLDVNSDQNQLDQTPRRFYLSGNQEQEFIQYQQEEEQEQEGGRHHQSQSHQSHKGSPQEQSEGGNIFTGFTDEFLGDALNVNKDIVKNLRGKNEEEEKGQIVRVKGGLSVTIPPLQKQQDRPQQEEQEEDEDEEQRPQPQRESEGRRSADKNSNGIDETICAMRLRHNIGQSSSPDIYNPEAGSIKTSTSLDFPALWLLKLSAEYGTLRKNAMFVPHYNLNAHSIIYALQGSAWLQVVNCNGERVFDGNLEEGQVLIVPQNFVVAAKSLSDNFRYVSFKTNDTPMIGTLAGRNSLINAMPEEVIQNTFNLRRQQARQIKNNNLFNYLVPPRESQRRAVA